MTDFHAELERIYMSYEAELKVTQENIDRCQREANEWRDRHTMLLNDRAEAIKKLSREADQ